MKRSGQVSETDVEVALERSEGGGDSKGSGRRAWPMLACILGAFLLLESFLPLGTAVKIGADEDYELSKATLCMKGYRLYTEVWNDQPRLVTFMITKLLQHVSPSVLSARLLTVCFAAVLLSAFFLLVLRGSGLLAAGAATVMLIASPGFIELSSSCMQELLALAPVVLALCLLVYGGRSIRVVVCAGVVFGFGLQMKLIGVIYLPLALLVLWLQRQKEGGVRRVVVSGVVFGSAVAAAFVGLNCVTGNPLLAQFQQSWSAHFASTQSFEYGSPADRPFDWGVLVRNWDTTVPALLGASVLLRQLLKRKGAKGRGESHWAALALAWLGIVFVVFPIHRPWWPYYYVHNAVPLCWCGAVGLVSAFEWLGAWGVRGKASGRGRNGPEKRLEASGKTWIARVAMGGLALTAGVWMCGRVYIEETGIRALQRLDSCLVLKEINRFKPFATFLFAHDPIYTFHSGIPMPPRLAVISLKRLWTGDMSNARLVAEVEAAKPGLILIPNDATQRPFQEILDREYKLVYFDQEHRLFAHQSISKRAK